LPLNSDKIETDMLKTILVCSVCIFFCAGCDTAAKQQQAEAARTAATAATLKQAGGELHNSTTSGTPIEPAKSDSP
jgi:uncharacterized lipoprotein YajG